MVHAVPEKIDVCFDRNLLILPQIKTGEGASWKRGVINVSVETFFACGHKLVETTSLIVSVHI